MVLIWKLRLYWADVWLPSCLHVLAVCLSFSFSLTFYLRMRVLVLLLTGGALKLLPLAIILNNENPFKHFGAVSEYIHIIPSHLPLFQFHYPDNKSYHVSVMCLILFVSPSISIIHFIHIFFSPKQLWPEC